MIEILLGTLGIFSVIFLEHFFLELFTFSMLILLAVNMWNRVGSRFYILMISILSLGLDVTMHQPFGLHLLVLGISLSILSILGSLLPSDRSFGRYISLFFVFLVYYISDILLLSLLQDGILPVITVKISLQVLFSCLVSVAISLLIDSGFSSVRDSKNFEKIRLR